MMVTLTKPQQDVLTQMKSDGRFNSNVHRYNVAVRLMTMGLLERVDAVHCNECGHIKEYPTFKLTPLGEKVAASPSTSFEVPT